MSKKPPAASRVPQSRLGRLARLGLAAGELAVGGAVQGLRRLAKGSETEPMFSVATARRLVERLANLRGAAMKLGQLISLESEGLLPPELSQALESLRSQAAPMPLTQLRRVLGRAYGSGWERRFVRFDETPIASASIGQVHRVRTVDGRELALKVQYPGVARSITSDVDNVATLLRLAQLLPLGVDVEEIAREAKRQLAQEADYLAESGFLEQYASPGGRRSADRAAARALGSHDRARDGDGLHGGRAARVAGGRDAAGRAGCARRGAATADVPRTL